MHELSIALSIVELADAEVKKAGGHQVETIVLEIGSLSGVEIEALNFAWQEAVKDSVLEGAICKIEIKTALARCLNCNREFNPAFLYDCCPSCAHFKKELLRGKEVNLKSLTIF